MAKEKKKPEKEKKEQTAAEQEPDAVKAPETEAAEAPAEKTAEEKLAEQLAAEKDKYLRLYAEYDNYRKRTTAEKDRVYSEAIADAINEILPIADSVTMALSQFEGKDVPEEFRKGIELIAAQLKTSFDKLKIEPFGEIGDTFDPMLHNAVSMTCDDSLPENSVAAVYQKGYKTGDRIIRHAMVVVANA